MNINKLIFDYSKISIEYTLKWKFKNAPYFQMTLCKKVFNLRNGKLVKCTTNGGTVGWWINRKWISKNKVNEHVELLKLNK